MKLILEATDHRLRARQLRAEVLDEAPEGRVVAVGCGFSEGGAAAARGPPLRTTVQRCAHLQVIELCQGTNTIIETIRGTSEKYLG